MNIKKTISNLCILFFIASIIFQINTLYTHAMAFMVLSLILAFILLLIAMKEWRSEKMKFPRLNTKKETPEAIKTVETKKEAGPTRILQTSQQIQALKVYSQYTLNQLFQHGIIEETTMSEPTGLTPAITKKHVLYVITDEITDAQLTELRTAIGLVLQKHQLLIQEMITQ